MDFYDVARQVTDEVCGEGTYAQINAQNRDPGVQAAIRRASLRGNERHFIRPATAIAVRWDGTEAAANRICELWKASKDKDFLVLTSMQGELYLSVGQSRVKIDRDMWCISIGTDPDGNRTIFFLPDLADLRTQGWVEE